MAKKKQKEKMEHPVLLGMLFVAIISAVTFVVLYRIEESKPYIRDFNPEEVYYVNYTFADNEYKVIDPDEISLVKSYYNDFKYYMLNDTKEAWNKVSKSNKRQKFKDSYDKFTEFLKGSLTDNTKTNIVERYNIKKEGTRTIYSVIDNDSNMYVFTAKGVWNYTVELKGKVEIK